VVEAVGTLSPEVQVKIVHSSTTENINLEIISTDDSELSTGWYTIHARVQGADQITVKLDGQAVEVRDVVNDGEWHDLTFQVKLAEYGEHTIIITAANLEEGTFDEAILDVNYVANSGGGGSSKPDAPGTPSTGSYITIGGVKVKTSYLWVFGANLVIFVLFIVIIRRRSRSSRAN
jgi:hypothetical protein